MTELVGPYAEIDFVANKPREAKTLPQNDHLIKLVKKARISVDKGRLFIPTTGFARYDWKNHGWIVSPPLPQDTEIVGEHEMILWAGDIDKKTHNLTSIGGSVASTGLDQQTQSSMLEIVVINESTGEASGHHRSGKGQLMYTDHTIYISGQPVSEPGVMTLIAGKPNFANFNLTTTLRSFTNSGKGPLLLKAMVGSVLIQSNNNTLSEVVPDETTNPPKLSLQPHDLYSDVGQAA